jgi:outer membrane receptor protein involved in Fe transport
LSRLDWLLDLPKLQLETRASWRSSIALDNFASQTNPGWLRLDVGLVVAPKSWLRLRADATNLLDYRRAVDGLQRPLPGRAYFFSMELVAGP